MRSFLFGFAKYVGKDVDIIASVSEVPKHEGRLEPSILFPPAWNGGKRYFLIHPTEHLWAVMFTPPDESGQEDSPPFYWGQDAVVKNPWVVLQWDKNTRLYQGFHCDQCAGIWLDFIIDKQEEWERAFKFIGKQGIPKSIQKH